MLPCKYKNKYRIPTNRLFGRDYGANGCYYVTICIKNRMHYFGEIVADSDMPVALHPTQIGKIAEKYWEDIPNHFPFVVLDKFVIMPNHIHGILFFAKNDKRNWKQNEFGKQSQNLGSVIRAFKASLKRYANENNIEFAWQSRFYDIIVRDEIELNNIRTYINDNPISWQEDIFNSQAQAQSQASVNSCQTN